MRVNYKDNIANEYKNLIQKYDRLGWKCLPLKGKKPFWEGWNNPEMWKSTYSNDVTLRTLELDNSLNVGILTGELSGIIAIDIDNPKLAGFREEKLNELINQGVLIHTTSRGPRLIFRSSNPEVLNFSKKLVKKRNEVSDDLISEADKEKEVISVVEILGNNCQFRPRQFLAPPSVHPRTGQRLKWISPLPEKPEDIYEIKDLNHLRSVLLDLFDHEIVLEIFGDLGRAERERKEVGEEVLNEWLETILKHLNVAKDCGDYVLIHCPFHPPDVHPSFAIYRNTYLAVCFHDGSVYTLKELAEKLGIKLPHAKKEKKENIAWIKLEYNDRSFGWLKIEKVGESQFIAEILDDEGNTVVPPRFVKIGFTAQPNIQKYFFNWIKDQMDAKEFANFLSKLTRITLKKMRLLEAGVGDEDESSDFDFELLKRFGIETEDAAKRIREAILDDDFVAVADLLLTNFTFRTWIENEEILFYENGVYKLNGERKIKELIQELLTGLGLKKIARTRLINEVIDYVRRSTYVSFNDFLEFDNKPLINFKNGVYDLETGEFLPHSPNYLFLWQIPHDYDPEADCPRVKRFLKSLVDTEEEYDKLLKMSAYPLLPSNPFQIVFFLVGEGSNGKGTFVTLLRHAYGSENVSGIDLHTLESNRFAGYQLIGKLFNVDSDLSRKPLDELKFLKKVSGEDCIYVERKFKDGFTVPEIRTKLFFLGNHFPKIEDFSYAVLRRIVIQEFRKIFPRNPKFKRELLQEEEIKGFLALLVEVARDLWVNGWNLEFSEDETWRKLIRYSSPVTAFFYECVEIDEDSEVKTDDIWEAFYSFCKKHAISFPYRGEGGRKVFFRDFRSVCEKNGVAIEKIRKNVAGVRYFVYRGIRLKEPEPDDNHDNDDNDADNSSPPNNDSPNFIDEEELKEELLRELLDDNTEGESEGEEKKEDESRTPPNVDEEDSGEREDEEETYRCVCGFETSDWKEIDKHRAFCDEFQRLQAMEAKKVMEKIFGKHDEEEDEEDGEEKEEETKDNNRECEKTAKINNEANDSPDFSVLINGDVKYVTVRILEDLPEFVGLDEKIYTLKAGEVVKVPEINASILIRHGKAVEIKEGDFG